MSQEKVDKMRAALDAFNRRDKTAFLAACHPDIKNVPPREWPEFVVTEGPVAVWDFFVANNDPWEQSPFEYAEVIRRWQRHVCGGDARRDAGHAERCRRPLELLAGSSVPRREGGAPRMVQRPRRGPRSRGPVGVDDVAGELGDRRAGFRRAEPRRRRRVRRVYHAEAEIHELVEMPDHKVYRGHDEIRQWAEAGLEIFPGVRWTLEEVVHDADNQGRSGAGRPWGRRSPREPDRLPPHQVRRRLAWWQGPGLVGPRNPLLTKPVGLSE